MGIFHSKLTKRYLIVSLIASVFSLALVYVITVHVVNTSVREGLGERNQLMAKTLTKQSEIRLQQIISDIKGISPYVLAETESSKKNYLNDMRQLVIKNPLYRSIKVFDKNGKSLASVHGVGFTNTSEFKQILNRLSWSKTYHISNLITLDAQKQVIAVSYPTVDEDGEFIGGVTALINLNTLSNYLNQVKIGDEGINVLVDREGKIIIHSDERYIGQDIEEHVLSTFLKKGRFGDWEGFLFGEKMLLSYRSIPIGGFGIIVGETVEQAIIPVINLQRILMESFLIVLVVTITFTIIGTKRVVKPINDLIKQVKEYKQRKRSGFPLLNTNDELQELSITMHEMAQELISTEQRLFNILESIPYAVITTNKYGEIATFNKAAEQLTRFSREEVTGKSIFDFPIQENNSEKIITWETFLEGRELNELEARIIDKEKEEHDIRVYSSWFNDELKNKVGTLLILRDVSEIKKLEDYLKQSERLASLGQLTAGIAHEIKNPLSIIQVAAEAIRYETGDKQMDKQFIRELSEDILETNDRLNLLLTDFLKMSKDEKGTRKEKVDLVFVIDELLILLRKKVEEQNITVISAYKELDEASVYASENKLVQVFLNILLNSLQAMELGGKIEINIYNRELDWEVEIRDTGKGIPASNINWIFNHFYTTKKEGTGLGLSISYDIIVQSKGNIRAESKVGEGTSIFVSLPKFKEGEQADEIDITRG
ncbi:sensor histidine kinase [Alkalihalobacillus deserti]|uniref:sensor histidine kinase n=1 Tax=Alkalihalobacillus deserti TaxID=2879466 RepID=UPI001D15ACAA|nr:PAS domain-containing sensor histidine kinase [Alkalihalobacillus deserti]